MKQKPLTEEIIEAMKKKGMDPGFYALNKDFHDSAILIDLRSNIPFLFDKH